MKKFLSLFIVLILITPVCRVYAKNSYITINPMPYPSYTLGEELIVSGKTDFSKVIVSLFTPPTASGFSIAKLSTSISQEELAAGYIIPTDNTSQWLEGNWTIRVAYGSIVQNMTVLLTKEPRYDYRVIVGEYENSILTKTTTYPCRKMFFADNILQFTTAENEVVKIFSWNNFSPVSTGQSRVFIAKYKDNILTSAQSYIGEADNFSTHFTLNIEPDKKIKLFYWDSNQSPIED